MNGWAYAFWHQFARGLASASIVMFFQGKAEALGLKVEGTEAASLAVGLFVSGVLASKAESWFEERKKREAQSEPSAHPN